MRDAKRRWLSVGASLLVALLLVGGIALAQEADTRKGLEPQEVLSTRFTYQGKLDDDGTPVSGTCQIAFRLYRGDAPHGPQIGEAITSPVVIQDGFFTTMLDFGEDAFDGSERWLGLRVKCAGDPAYTDLGRQALSPAPFALYATQAPWHGLTNVPLGLDDGDDVVTYTAGAGLQLNGREFSVVSGTLEAHDHWGETWSGSGTGLQLDSSSGDGLKVSSDGGDGLNVSLATDEGVRVGMAGQDGVRVAMAGRHGVCASGGDDDGEYGGWFEGYGGLYGKGNGKNGYGGHFVGEQNHGLYVEGGMTEGADGVHVQSAQDHGVFVFSAGGDGMRVHSASGDGVRAFGGVDEGECGGWFKAYNGVYGEGTGSAGYGGYFNSDHDDGVRVDTAGNDGISIADAGNDGVHVTSADRYGVYASGASADVVLGGGEAGSILADPTEQNGDIALRSNDEVEVHLDDDLQNSTSHFTVFNGSGDEVFEVDEDGNVTWAPQTGYLAVPAAAFRPAEQQQHDFLNWGFEVKDPNCYGYFLRAAVYLPHGAVVTAMTYNWHDMDSRDDTRAVLERVSSNGDHDPLATVESNGNAGDGSSQDSTIDLATIDNSQYAYFVLLDLGCFDYKAYSVIIEYTYFGPH